MHAAKNIILAMLVMTSFGCVQQLEHIDLPRGFDPATTKAHIPSNYANRDDKKINDQTIPSQLSLQKCIEISLRNNPDFSAVKYDVEAASARFEGAKSALWPKISVVGGYTHYNDKIRLVQAAYNGEPGLFTADIASEDIVLALPLFSGGKDWNNIKATDLLSLSAENKMAFSREELIFNVTSLYMSILAEEHVIRALEFSYAALEEQAKRITSLINEQKAANVDLLRAEVRLADVREKIILEKNVYATTRLSLINMLGTPIDEKKLSLSDQLLPPMTTTVDNQYELKEVLKKRKDYQAALNSLDAQSKNIAIAQAAFLPTVGLKAAYGQRQTVGPYLTVLDSKRNPIDLKENVEVASVGVVFEIPLFEGGNTMAKVREEKSKFMAAKNRLEKLEKQIDLEVRSATLQLQSAVSRISSTKKAVEQAKESYRIESMKYDLGKGTILDTLNAQSELITAQVNYYKALADYNIYSAKLRFATGALS